MLNLSPDVTIYHADCMDILPTLARAVLEETHE